MSGNELKGSASSGSDSNNSELKLLWTTLTRKTTTENYAFRQRHERQYVKITLNDSNSYDNTMNDIDLKKHHIKLKL